MRRLGWVVAGIGVAVAAGARFLRRTPRARESFEPVGVPGDARADELRQRIAESRALVDEREQFEEAETPVDEADPDARRREVHARGREAADRMRGESS